MVSGHGQTMLTWSWSDHVNMVMPLYCIYSFNSNFLTKKCLKMSVGDLRVIVPFVFPKLRILFVVLDR